MGKLKGVGLYHFSVTIFFVSTILTCLGVHNSTVGCFEKERLALLKFRHSLTDYNNKLSSWVGRDCCKWFAVGCDGHTGHVVSLHLRGNSWDGVDRHGTHFDISDSHFLHDGDFFEVSFLASDEVNSGLAELSHLKYLDLSGNDFRFSGIPEFIGYMKQLRYLNLSCSSFVETIPHHLGNLSNLEVLDLGYNQLMIDDMAWVSGLSTLKHLDLSEVGFSQSRILDKLIYMFPSLIELHLSNCELENIHLDPSHRNSSSMLPNIKHLDLSWNLLRGPLPFLQNMTSLVSLDLSNYDLSQAHSFEKLLGIIPSLYELHLSDCNIISTHVSPAHVNFSKHCGIQHLGLRHNLIEGKFPDFLINLSSLVSLDLSDNFLYSSFPVMPKLRILDLSYNNFNHIGHIGIWKRCRLKQLRVDHNHFKGEMIDGSSNMSECSSYALEMLDLSENQFIGSIPESLRTLTSLRKLYLNSNQLTGIIPFSLGKLIALERLSLETNKLNGPIPSSLGRLVSLQKLSVSSNFLNGRIPSSMGQLTKLVFVDVSNNSLEGVVSETHFAKLSQLKYLDATSNPRLTFNISDAWIPTFQLRRIRIGSCKIAAEFPRWLRTQKNLRELVMSNSSISGHLPKWMQKMPIIPLLDLSQNQLSGPLTNLPSIKPLVGFGIDYYDGSLFLKNNFFKGPIPKSLCEWTHLGILDLSENMLSGNIPWCLGNLIYLKAMVLNSNKLSGVIPNFIGNMTSSLTWLNLSNNSLRGELPISLGNFVDLRVLDLGDNNLSGSIPGWIGEQLIHLVILRLHKNHLTGRIPRSLCNKYSLNILDIAHNNITGDIPRCFKELSGMVSGSHESIHNDSFPSHLYTLQVMKGVYLVYTTTLQLVINMDLSSNKLVGETPEELTTLSKLVGLNLSHNNLIGGIPNSIGNLKALISLDFSENKLTGTIPSSMSTLNFLSYLNLSHNNLSGQIPTGNQLQTLVDPSIYTGNRDLCGAPLPKNCSNHEDPTVTASNVDYSATGPTKQWFYLDIMCGFATGFWGIIGVLVFKRQWRRNLFVFVDLAMDKIQVIVAVRVSKMKRGRQAA